ncbi:MULTISPECIES: hypothetical protein [Leptolyngbya]|jgi:hypothetical protein|uniref:Addiction module component n=2 Tax=Leptolyngbya boryana TaxID=1184 RepID=A0A1Z4JQG9_LEPBY|nr:MULTISPECIES: hypothetical protein [Leptolyngbya]BAY58903.1 hypothetical protein NIES2135_57780 [Leptolyngbya boryana NIES-2135]MBD1859531.1 hypothetical protein [Leptolyngbya sp. FACHB-1624]MBD2370510.1 hypothetical protein [Leptolyngbya sp. FACHB-161]MBD2376934.1 hypothetical protein [Leptolyngbya sp. FACHB-238]MBD2401301.1 hypothetical protein [Leptolyngbya sp. FACHB-239]
MTSAVIEILKSIEALSHAEQQELIRALCDREMDQPLEVSLGADPSFDTFDAESKREALRQKLLSGLEQVQQGRVVDGEVVFERFQARLRQMSESQE